MSIVNILFVFFIFATSFLTFVLLYIYIYPVFRSKFFKNNYLRPNCLDDKAFTLLIQNAAVEMIHSKKTAMPLHNNQDFIGKIYNIVYHRKLEKKHYYGFSRAFLMWSITELILEGKESNNLSQVIDFIGNWVNKDGKPIFELKFVDRIVFGLVSLNLYKITGEERYKKNCEFTFNHVSSLVKDNGLIVYLETDYPNIQFVDILGMVCPFLIKYGENFNDENAIKIGLRQIDFYIENGLNKNGLPFQFINIDSNMGVGTNNWGRGISWYILGLTSVMHLNKKYRDCATTLWKTLISLKISTNNPLWSQFPGASLKFDSSSTVPFLYLANQLDSKNYSLSTIKELLSKYITDKGKIDHTSGVPWGIGLHSDTFGFSEFTQGMLLLLVMKAVTINNSQDSDVRYIS